MTKRRTDRLRYTGELSFQELMRLSDKEAEAKELRMTVQQLLTKKHHPVAIGSVIECNAYPSLGRSICVKHRHMERDGDSLYWVAVGRCINNDGSESKRNGRWQQKITDKELRDEA